MMSSNKNIDQIFSDAAHSQKAPAYDSTYWNEMNAMLNARDKKRKGFFFWMLGGATVTSVLIASLFIFNTESTDALYHRAESNLKIETITENKELLAKNEVQNTEIQSSTTLDNNLEVSTLNTNNSNYRATQEVTTNNNKVNGEVASTPNTDKSNSVYNTLENNNEFVNTEETPLNTNDTHPLLTQEKISEDISEEPTQEITKEDIDALPERSGLGIVNVLPRGNEVDNLEDEVAKTNLFPMFLKVGGGLMENYKTSRPYESGLFDISLQFEAKIKNLTLRSGFGTQMTFGADLIMSDREKLLELGVPITMQDDLTYQTLVDVYIPVEFGIRIKNTSFGIGVQANYLASTKMTLNQYKSQILINSEEYRNYFEGLNKFTAQGYLWVEHQFIPRLHGGLRIGTHLNSRINELEYFNESSATNPIYGQFFLRFDIFK